LLQNKKCPFIFLYKRLRIFQEVWLCCRQERDTRFSKNSPMMTPARKSPDLNLYSGRFASRLLSFREKAGLTQEDVAKAMGVSISAVFRWESGQHHPDPDALPQLAKLLGLKNVRLLFPIE
jgi:ribosome-binding protein aMBF1 (putative translation factor)